MTVAQGTPSLIERLRDEAADWVGNEPCAMLCSEAADVIAALSAQVAELETAAEYANKVADRWQSRAIAAEASGQVVELQRKAEMYPTIDSDGGREMEIMVNGENTLAVDGRVDKSGPLELTYGHIVGMAGYEPERILSITYSTNRKGDEQRQGVLSPGRSVVVEEGMRFYVADTSNA